MSSREMRIAVQKTARYYLTGEPDPATRELWLCCHGFGQLAGRFSKQLDVLASPKRVIVAPEALHRFYLDPMDRPAAERRVGASWMTREDRETDIADYVRYLDAVCAQLCPAAPGAVLVGFGFSQGTATIARWAAATTQRVHRLVLWGSGLPPDLDWQSAGARLREIPITLVGGKQDPMMPAHRWAEQQTLLNDHGIGHELILFEGGHQLDTDVLRKLAD
ncbi:MAG: alpha/beta hydrolase [Longimicrobiales bacterium]